MLPLFVGVLCLILVLLCSTLCSSLAKRVLVALLVLSYCSVPYFHGAVGWTFPVHNHLCIDCIVFFIV